MTSSYLTHSSAHTISRTIAMLNLKNNHFWSLELHTLFLKNCCCCWHSIMVEFNPVDSLLSEDILAHLHTIPQHPEVITGTDTEQMIKRNDWESETAVVSDLILSPSIPFSEITVLLSPCLSTLSLGGTIIVLSYCTNRCKRISFHFTAKLTPQTISFYDRTRSFR